MTLLQMSFSGAVLILAVLLARALLLNRLPKQTFLILWGLVLFKLLVPIAIPAPCSVYSLGRDLPADPLSRLPDGIMAEAFSEDASGLHTTSDVTPHDSRPMQADIPLWPSLAWCAGAALCAAFFLFSYLRCRLEFGTSLPVCDPAAGKWLEQWLDAHPARRTVTVRQSDRIDTPLTYGIFRPVILLPGNTDWQDTDSLRYILSHEYVHIRRLDAVTKLVMALALCLHWFNPLVWAMYLLFNRDLELACDEKAVRQLGEPCKAAYAHMLINMEARRSGLPSLYNHFSQNAIKERITAIMKLKKTSRFTILLAVCLTVGTAAAFATSAVPASDSETVKKNTAAAAPDTVNPSYRAPGEENRASAGLSVQDNDLERAEHLQNTVAELERQYEDAQAAVAAYEQQIQQASSELQEILALQDAAAARVDDAVLQIGIQNERFAQWEDTLSPYLPFGVTFYYDPEQDYVRMYFHDREVRGIFDPQREIYIAEHLGIIGDTFDEDAIELTAVYENGTLTGLQAASAEETP